MEYINFAERAAEALKKLLDSEEFRNALDKLRDLAVTLEDAQAYIEEIKKKRHTYIRKMSVISKKALNMINSKVVRRKTNTRARESHKKTFSEEEDAE
nr:hypothetical protein [uncultured Cellulosilyticum sp.]